MVQGLRLREGDPVVSAVPQRELVSASYSNFTLACLMVFGASVRYS